MPGDEDPGMIQKRKVGGSQDPYSNNDSNAGGGLPKMKSVSERSRTSEKSQGSQFGNKGGAASRPKMLMCYIW
jgi:hypothetical protein